MTGELVSAVIITSKNAIDIIQIYSVQGGKGDHS